MAKWICKVCGYTHYGHEVPEFCPKCGAPRSQFKKEDKQRGCAFSILMLIALLTAFGLNLTSCSTASTVDNSTVQSLDLNRFMGRWYFTMYSASRN